MVITTKGCGLCDICNPKASLKKISDIQNLEDKAKWIGYKNKAEKKHTKIYLFYDEKDQK